jgi:ribonuclease III
LRKGSEITQLCKRLDYRFQKEALLKEALTHRSVGTPNNERLEFLGDSVLNFAIADLLLSRFPDRAEGQLSRLRAALVRGECLAEIAKDLSLGEVVILGPGELRSGGHRRASILADTLEAIIGAIYLDSGFEIVKKVIHRLYEHRIQDPDLDASMIDHKSFLQEKLQAKKMSLPRYELIKVTGEIHDQFFYVTCSVANTTHIGKGEGVTRRKAEQAAAEDMIAYLKLKPIWGSS